MEVKIGVQHVGRELSVETDETAEAVTADGVFALTDVKGRTVIVPAARIAYVELGVNAPGTVGFR